MFISHSLRVQNGVSISAVDSSSRSGIQTFRLFPSFSHAIFNTALPASSPVQRRRWPGGLQWARKAPQARVGLDVVPHFADMPYS